MELEKKYVILLEKLYENKEQQICLEREYRKYQPEKISILGLIGLVVVPSLISYVYCKSTFPEFDALFYAMIFGVVTAIVFVLITLLLMTKKGAFLIKKLTRGQTLFLAKSNPDYKKEVLTKLAKSRELKKEYEKTRMEQIKLEQEIKKIEKSEKLDFEKVYKVMISMILSGEMYFYKDRALIALEGLLSRKERKELKQAAIRIENIKATN